MAVSEESRRIGAAYSLACDGKIEQLLELLTTPNPAGLPMSSRMPARRAAMYGLAAAGDCAAGSLRQLLRASVAVAAAADETATTATGLAATEQAATRQAAVFALGEAAAPTSETVDVLATMAADARTRLAHAQEQHRAAVDAAEPMQPLPTTAGLDTADDTTPQSNNQDDERVALACARIADSWDELCVVGQAVWCLAQKQSCSASATSALLVMACELLNARDEEAANGSDSAVSSQAPALRRHGAHALVSLASRAGGATEPVLTQAAIAACADPDRYVQGAGWALARRLMNDGGGVGGDDADNNSASSDAACCDNLASAKAQVFGRLVDMRFCSVTAVTGEF